MKPVTKPGGTVVAPGDEVTRRTVTTVCRAGSRAVR